MVVENKYSDKKGLQQRAQSIKKNNRKDQNNSLSLNKILLMTDRIDRLKATVNKELKKHNTSYNEWRIINEIVDQTFVTPQFISKKLEISPSLVSRYLDLLEQKTYINRLHMDEGDRRFVRLKCTKKGKSIWRKGFSAFMETNHIDILQ